MLLPCQEHPKRGTSMLVARRSVGRQLPQHQAILACQGTAKRSQGRGAYATSQ